MEGLAELRKEWQPREKPARSAEAGRQTTLGGRRAGATSRPPSSCAHCTRSASGTLRSVDSMRRSFSLSRAIRFIDSATGVLGFFTRRSATE